MEPNPLFTVERRDTNIVSFTVFVVLHANKGNFWKKRKLGVEYPEDRQPRL